VFFREIQILLRMLCAPAYSALPSAPFRLSSPSMGS